jgi:hypothetical protein
MRQRVLLLLFSSLVISSLLPRNAQTRDQTTHAPSGDSQLMTTSIAVPPIPNAPFTATVSTKWVRKLEDGSTVTIQNRRKIARDNSGRVFQERRMFYPEGDSREPALRQLEFADPSSHTIVICHTPNRTCEIRNFYALATVPPPLPPGPFDEGKKFLRRVDLGADTVNGLEAIGSLETTTIYAGVIGNDRTVEVVKEFWYSPQLGINLIEKRQDPRSGTQDFAVSDISLGEPDAKTFELPADYRKVDQRKQEQRSEQGGGSN